MNYVHRLGSLRQYMREKSLDGFLVSQTDNRRYLSGFAGSAGNLLITERLAILATDFRYVEQAKLQAPNFETVQIRGELANWLPPLIAEHGIQALAFEAEDVTYAAYSQLAEALARTPPAKLVPTQGVVPAIRAAKDVDEMALIRKAIAISEKAFAYLPRFLKSGLTEKAIAWKLESFMREHGSDKMPYDVIVASGPNAALPHHHPGERAVRDGEPIIIDMGASTEGYGSDLTRTFCLGTPDEMYRNIYSITLRAQQNAIENVKPGLSGGEVDAVARRIIEEAGYGDKFGHGLGHGVGMATHEEPRLGPGSSTPLHLGMAVTIEPGIYLPGWGGVRIEDDVYVTPGGPQVLSLASRNLHVGIDKSIITPR